MSARIRQLDIEVRGRVLTYLDHPKLAQAAYRAKLLAFARELVRRHALEGLGEAEPFKALHAALYELDVLLEQGCGPGDHNVDELVTLYDGLCDLLYQGNLGLVYDMRGRTHIGRLDPSDVESDGCLALLRAVRTFNPWLGFRFSTYACRSIQRAFHLLGRRRQQQSRLMHEKIRLTQNEEHPEVDATAVPSSDGPGIERLRRILVDNEADLTAAERLVITQRFLVDEGRRPATLNTVGTMLKLSKERVRQIQVSALDKLRHELEVEPGDELPHASGTPVTVTADGPSDASPLLLRHGVNGQAA